MNLGDYNIDRVLGTGSTATVHHAVRISDGLEVAIKRLPQHNTASDRERVQGESAALSRLNHPNIVKLIEIIDDTNELVIVTEYAARGTLASLLETRGKLDDVETVNLLTPIADALHAAHQAGIVHQDVKPSNIFLRQDGTPVLGDFGLATDEIKTPDTKQVALGSAAYLDPNVLHGQTPSPLSDEYSLGVVAYECLTGVLPYAGDTTSSVIRRAEIGNFAALNRVTLGPLTDHVERAFARKRTDRFSTLAELAAAWRDPLNTAARQTIGQPVRQTIGQAPGQTAGHAVDSPIRATAQFALPTRPNALSQAVPVTPPKPWKKIGLIAATFLVVAGVGGGLVVRQRNEADAGPGGLLTIKTACDPTTIAQCVESYQRNPAGVRVTFRGDSEPTQYSVGERSDSLRIGNFFCGSAETLVLYRPSTGVVYYFKDWPLAGENTEVAADSTEVLNATLGVSDTNSDGCADVALDTEGTRTWFTPAVQPERLEAVDQALTKTSG